MRAVCVTKCPAEVNSTIECHGTERVSEKECQDPSFYIGYGTIRVLKRFCLPDPDKLADELDDDHYDNIIGSFGLDDVSEIAQDLEEGQYAFVITFFTCIFVTIIYSILIYSLTGVIVWLSIVGCAFGILGLAHMLQHHVRKIKPKKNKDMIKPESDRTGYLIQLGVYLLYGLFVFFVICVACMWRNI